MITNFIKEVKSFYETIYKTDLTTLRLVDLQAMQKQMEDFYSSELLNLNSSEDDKFCSFLAYEILGFYSDFCLWEFRCPEILEFLTNLSEAQSINELKAITLKRLSNVARRVNSIIRNNTVIETPTRNVVLNSDLNSYNYLYYYGEKVTKNHMQIVDYFNRVSEDKITSIAKCTVDSFLRGLEKLGKGGVNISKKNYVCLFYPMGFEKVAKKLCELLEGKLDVVLRLYDNTMFDKQIDYNFRYDYNFYLSEEYVNNYLSCFETALKENSDTFERYAGPIFIETFGENRFVPENGFEIFKKDSKLAELNSSFDTKYSVLYMNHIRKDTSFTIISYPCPEIGKDFEDIFDDTIKINTLDNEKYENIQQKIIDVLDKSDTVHVTGRNGNKTDLVVSLAKLSDANTQTKFENCTADVNVPVGEVFTSPVLKGTNGTLHVSEIYLNGWKFIDLCLVIEDGFIKEYSCKNYPTQKENAEYINEHLLYDHKTLPMGEFAIGTNTTAYVMGNKYQINDKLDILIAEKTGPHFAFGDTCYSMDEETKVFNPDGKEVVAKDNEVSIKRAEDSYFGCHTDVTIPYYELGDIVAIGDSEVAIIRDGKFVLEGTAELNIEGM
ncbi:MAG: aminopeptidase [Clostridia bacterium]|nr:aminopeptidase [Clostridia bacterium]